MLPPTRVVQLAEAVLYNSLICTTRFVLYKSPGTFCTTRAELERRLGLRRPVLPESSIIVIRFSNSARLAHLDLTDAVAPRTGRWTDLATTGMLIVVSVARLATIPGRAEALLNRTRK